MKIQTGSSSLRLLRRLTLAEHGSAGEDRWAGRGRTWALCDGASEGYDGAGWATYLSRQLILTGGPLLALERARRLYFEARKAESNQDWLSELGSHRGSWSTALRVRYFPSRAAVEVLARGDTVFFLRDGLETVASFPLEDGDTFDSRPELLADRAENDGTALGETAGSSIALFRRSIYCLRRLGRPRIIMATDSLAQRLLSAQGPERVRLWAFLDRCSSAQFHLWARDEMSAGTLRRDDLTLLELAP